MSSKNPSDYDTLFYQVRPGDNLSAIIKNYYGPVSQGQRKDIISRILAGNPGMTMINRTFKANAPLMAEIIENYNDYKDKGKKISKGQYDYRRKNLINRLRSRLGPTGLVQYGFRPPQ